MPVLTLENLAFLQARGEGELLEGYRTVSTSSYCRAGTPGSEDPVLILIPDQFDSRQTVYWLGFIPWVANTLFERFEGTGGSLLAVILHHIMTFPFIDAFAPEDNWLGGLAALGVTQWFADDLMAPQLEDMRSCFGLRVCVLWMMLDDYGFLMCFNSYISEIAAGTGMY